MKIFKKLFLLPILALQLHAENPVQRIAVRAFHKFRNRLGLTARVVDAQSFRRAIVQTAQDVGPAFTKFVEQYGISGETLEVVFRHTQGGKTLPSYIENTYMGYIPDSNVYNKGDGLDRIINAIRMKEVIKRHNLTLLDVADKQIGCVKGQWRVFAKKVFVEKEVSIKSIINPENATHKMSLECIKQFIILIEETGYSDSHGGNWIFDTTGKLTCIDTENASFHWRGPTKTGTKLQFVSSLKDRCPYAMTPEAKQYLDDYIARLSQENNPTEQKKLPYNSEYDPEGIDLKQVEKEFYKRK